MTAYTFIIILPQILDVFVLLNKLSFHKHPLKFELFIDDEKHLYVIQFNIYFVFALITEVYNIGNGTLLIIYRQHAYGILMVLRYY